MALKPVMDQVTAVLRRAQIELSRQAIFKACDLAGTPDEVSQALFELKKAGRVERVEGGRWRWIGEPPEPVAVPARVHQSGRRDVVTPAEPDPAAPPPDDAAPAAAPAASVPRVQRIPAAADRARADLAQLRAQGIGVIRETAEPAGPVEPQHRAALALGARIDRLEALAIELLWRYVEDLHDPLLEQLLAAATDARDAARLWRDRLVQQPEA